MIREDLACPLNYLIQWVLRGDFESTYDITAFRALHLDATIFYCSNIQYCIGIYSVLAELFCNIYCITESVNHASCTECSSIVIFLSCCWGVLKKSGEATHVNAVCKMSQSTEWPCRWSSQNVNPPLMILKGYLLHPEMVTSLASLCYQSWESVPIEYGNATVCPLSGWPGRPGVPISERLQKCTNDTAWPDGHTTVLRAQGSHLLCLFMLIACTTCTRSEELEPFAINVHVQICHLECWHRSFMQRRWWGLTASSQVDVDSCTSDIGDKERYSVFIRSKRTISPLWLQVIEHSWALVVKPLPLSMACASESTQYSGRQTGCLAVWLGWSII